MNKIATFIKFSNRVKKSKNILLKIFKKLKKDNQNIISYGATYKSSTIFNYCKIGKNLINYVTDTTINKQGKFTPGQHIPIISPEKGKKKNVNYAFLGAWYYKVNVKSKNYKLAKYSKKKTRT